MPPRCSPVAGSLDAFPDGGPNALDLRRPLRAAQFLRAAAQALRASVRPADARGRVRFRYALGPVLVTLLIVGTTTATTTATQATAPSAAVQVLSPVALSIVSGA